MVTALTALALLMGCGLNSAPTPTITPVAAPPTAPLVVSRTPAGATPTRSMPTTPGATPATPINTAYGEWVTAGALGFGRAGHTATLLPDGRVLVVGGEGGSAPLASVEQYDPQANRWAAAPSLGLARSGHSATLLPSGEVLVVGGTIAPSGATSTTATVEIYDPGAGRWRNGAPLNQPRSGHTATLLPNGQVLVAGGEVLDAASGQARLVASAELYDPASNTWTLTAPPSRARIGHTATLLNDGRVLIAAGETSNASGARELDATAEIYDVTSGSWTLTGELSLARAEATATLLTNGQVLVVGGRVSGGNTTSAAELFDPARGVWLVATGAGMPRAEGTATRLLDGRVLVAGGYEREAAMPTASAERYDPASDGWVRVAPPLARVGGRAVLLNDGAVLVVGGRTTGGRYAEVAERFVPRGAVPATPSASTSPRPTATVPPTATAPATVVATEEATVLPAPTPEPTTRPPTQRPPTQRPPTNAPMPPRPTSTPTIAPAEPTPIIPATEIVEPTAIPPIVVVPTVVLPTATTVAPGVTPTVRTTPSPTVAPAATATATTPVTVAPARTGTIFGTIQFCAGQQCAPAAGAIVATDSGATRTDEGGVYALSGVPAGTVRVNVTYSPTSGGTYTATQAVIVPAGGRVQLNFSLQPAAKDTDDPTAAPVAPAALAGRTETGGR